ncbi:MAG: restriction endonuclease subunit S [Nitrosopumilus sp.]|nr:restriction endonuclease subunit S [Nitrosopumilus sp.]
MSESEQVLKISPGRTQKFPKDWKLYTLDEISDVIDPYPSHRAPKRVSKGVPYLGIGDFDEEGNILKISRHVSSSALKEQKETFSLKKGDLALGRVASIGKVVKLNPKQNYTISPTLAIIQPKIKPDFLRQVMLESYFQDQLIANVHGSTRSSVGIQKVRQIIIGVPKENEIEKISEILTNLESQQKIYEEIGQQTKNLKDGLIKKLFTKGIKHKKFKKIKIGIRKEIEIPEEWTLSNINKILSKEKYSIKRGPWGGSLKKEFFVKNGFKVYEQKNAIYNDFERGNYFINNEKFEELKDFEVRPGDFIISCSGTIGKIARIPQQAKKGIINQALLKISVDTEIIEPNFFMELFQTPSIQKLFSGLTHGSAMKNVLSISELKNISLKLPPIKEQQKIVSILTDIDSKIDEFKTKKTLFQNLRKGIMKNLLTGQIRVTI